MTSYGYVSHVQTIADCQIKIINQSVCHHDTVTSDYNRIHHRCIKIKLAFELHSILKHTKKRAVVGHIHALFEIFLQV